MRNVCVLCPQNTPTVLSHLPLCTVSGNALEKAGGRDFLEGVKELRKAQAPLEVAAGTDVLNFFSHKSLINQF